MLDELLGRAELKERIAELEDEKRHLERHAEAEEERRADAVRARQEAEERVNHLEDRVEELEDRVERLSGDHEELAFRDTTAVSGRRRDEVLRRLRSVDTDAEGALTAAVADADSVPAAVDDAFGDRVALVRRAAPCLALTDDAGLVCLALDPPRLPDAFAAWDAGFRLDDEWFRPAAGTAVVLVRSDLFVLGTYDGEAWSILESLESDVKSAHSKGGFSQSRFERRRDEQVAAHLDAGLDAIDDHDVTDPIVLGERTVLGEFESLAATTARVDASGAPEAAFEEALREFWTTRVYAL